MTEYYVYQYINPNTNTPYYIGKIKENLTEEEAYKLEEKLIKQYGRKGIDENGILMNICESGRPPSSIGRVVSYETRKKMSISRRGKVYFIPTENQIKKRVNKVSKLWQVVTPNGEELIVKNLKEFCRKMRLHDGRMYQVAKGKFYHHKGYKVILYQDN